MSDIFSPKLFRLITIFLSTVFFWQFYRLLKAFAAVRNSPSPSRKYGNGRRFTIVIVILFSVILIYQASWQLFGFRYEKFLNNMTLFDPRAPSAARQYTPGRIFDRNGVLLADNQVTPDGIRRFYPQGEFTCHLIGYDHPVYGRAGLEKACHGTLMGRTLVSAIEFLVFIRNTLIHSGLRGNNLHLTIDIELQKRARLLLGKQRGAIVMLVPGNGEILVASSSPDFDPNALSPTLFQTREGYEAPLLNRCFHGRYPPGSTFKVIVTSSALRHGLTELLFPCPAEGYTPTPGEKPIRDHEYYLYRARGSQWPGYGTIGLERALLRSSNVYFAQLGLHLGGRTLEDECRRYQLFDGLPLIPRDRENPGLTSTPGSVTDLTTMRMVDLARIAIGQGTLEITPLHLALMSATIANHGRLVRPRIVSGFRPAEETEVLSTAMNLKLLQLMAQVIDEGTGHSCRIPGLRIAGKTGTAENPHGKGHSWFTALVFDQEPSLAISVIVENAGFGSAVAVPIARELIQQARKLGYIQTTGKRIGLP